MGTLRGGYDEKCIVELFAGRKRLTAVDVLRLDIPVNARLWAVLRPELIGVWTVCLWAAWCAKQVPPRERVAGRKPDLLRWAVAVRRHAVGEISDGSLAATWAATHTLTRDDAWAAARSAACDTVGDAQINKLIEVLEEK